MFYKIFKIGIIRKIEYIYFITRLKTIAKAGEDHQLIGSDGPPKPVPHHGLICATELRPSPAVCCLRAPSRSTARS